MRVPVCYLFYGIHIHMSKMLRLDAFLQLILFEEVCINISVSVELYRISKWNKKVYPFTEKSFCPCVLLDEFSAFQAVLYFSASCFYIVALHFEHFHTSCCSVLFYIS